MHAHPRFAAVALLTLALRRYGADPAVIGRSIRRPADDPRRGRRMLPAGILSGVPILWALNRILPRAMPSMEPPGFWLLGVTLTVPGATRLLACWLRALRTTRVNPAGARRAE